LHRSLRKIAILAAIECSIYYIGGIAMLSYATRYAAKFRHALIPLVLAVGGAIASAQPVQALKFNFSGPLDVTSDPYKGFVAAGNLWSSIFTDNVTINIGIDYKQLAPDVLAQAGSSEYIISYDGFRSALADDRTSFDDILAVNNLQAGSSFNMLLNRTKNNPNGAASGTYYLDNNDNDNNQIIRFSSANVKALGLLDPNDPIVDALISFSSDFTFDFDRDDGIKSGAFDFIGIAAHEIGHALGFISGVDALDYYGDPQVLDADGNPLIFDDEGFIFVSPLDLFRYSSQSRSFGKGVIDWTADDRDKYFSLDGGDTMLGVMNPEQGFSTGSKFGDGYQASHWKDSLGRGIMDPTASYGELLQITELDKRAFDAIGWNRRDAKPIPTPAMLPGLIGIGLGFLRRRRSMQKA
jgi:hypothetical protein